MGKVVTQECKFLRSSVVTEAGYPAPIPPASLHKNSRKKKRLAVNYCQIWASACDGALHSIPLKQIPLRKETRPPPGWRGTCTKIAAFDLIVG